MLVIKGIFLYFLNFVAGAKTKAKLYYRGNIVYNINVK